MNEDIKSNYYAVIPATVRYDNELKAAEKLLYGEITALANKYGFCFAQNRYFADLYKVTIGTVSKWISHLQKLGYIKVIIEKNERNEIVLRKIYIIDTPYSEKRQYPYGENKLYPMVKNDKDNIINNKIDDLFLCIINRNEKIEKNFYLILNKLDILYDDKTIEIITEDKKRMIKEIIYTLYELYNSNFKFILDRIERQTLLNLYLICKDIEVKNQIQDFIQYYRKSLINQYSNNL